MRRLISLLLVLALLAGLLPASGGVSRVAAQTLGKKLMAPQALCPGDLIISEYIEGSSNNKAVEIFNGTGAPVDLTDYRLTLYPNGNTAPGNTYDFPGTLDAGDVFVIANPSADAAILAVADATDDVTYFNGNDALVLTKDGSVVDSIGDVGNATNWGAEVTLVRDPAIMAGDTITDDDFLVADGWLSYGQNTFDYLGSHTMNPCGPLTLIKSAPSDVWVGDVFTYTLVISNDGTGLTLTDLVLTDTLPLSVTVDTISDGGVQIGDTVSWTIASLDLGSSVTRTVSVMAPDVNTLLSNSDYAMVASNWTTPTVGPVVETAVGGQMVDIGTARGMDGELVRIAGRATMYTGGFYAGSGDAKFYIQDATGGVSIQCFDDYGTPQEVTLGDLVTVTGRVGAYQGEVQVVPEDNVNDVVITDGLPADVPAPIDMTVAEFSDPTALGWLARLHGQITRLDEDSFNYSLDLFDGTGTVEIYVDKDTSIDLSGLEVYDDYQVTGIAEAYYTTNELKPRIQDDFVHIAREILRVYKSAPAYAVSGLSYSYELLVTNNTPDTLNNVVLTDTVPADVTLAEVLDGGVQVGNVVSWTVPTLASGESFTVGFVVTATGTVGAIVLNDDYGALADEWPVLAAGPDVETRITAGCDPGDTPIYTIQGSGDASSMDGDPVTVCGVVIGVAPALSGFFIQDMTGDGDSATSDGIFVYRSSQPYAVSVGDLVEVSGDVDEYYGVTEIWAGSSTDALTVIANGAPVPSSVSLDPPPDRTAADTYLEAVEGMLVDVPVTVTVVGPTNAYGEYYFVRGDTGLGRLVRSTNPPDGYRLGVDDGIVTSADYVVGDVLDGMLGPLHYTFDEWKIEQMYQPTDVSLVIVPGTLPQYPPDDPGQVTLASFNVLNFDGLDDVVKLNKVVTSIVAMGGPDILSLEEIAAMDTWDSDAGYTITAVLDDLVTALAAQGYTYASAYSHPDVGGHGVAVLYNPDVFSVDEMTTLQDCSSYGSSSSTYDPIWDTCQGTGDYPLFSRRPVVLTGTLSSGSTSVPLTFIGAHLKSGIGDFADEQRRLEQAQLIAAFVANVQADGQERVVLAGDLNDFIASAPLLALQDTGMLTDTFYTLQPAERYSYIYNGVSQVLDHILVSGALFEEMDRFMPLHIDSDYPAGWEVDPDVPFGVSDHDPVLATFTPSSAQAELVLMKSVVPTAGVYPGDLVTYTLTLSNSGTLSATNVVLTDVLPWEVNFDGWLENSVGATVTDDTVSWSGTLAAEAMIEISFVASVRSDTAFLPHTVVNTAQVTADDVAPEEADAAFEVLPAPSDILIAKAVWPAADVPLGSVVTYTILLTNTVATTADGVLMTDTLPDAVTFGGWVGTAPAGTLQAGDMITWTGSLAQGSPLTFVFTATVGSDAGLAGQTVVNTASFTSADAGTGSATAGFTIEGGEELYLILMPLVVRTLP